MTCKSINVNENECFFCSSKDVKKYFSDTEIKVSFKRANILKFFNHKGPKKSSLPVKKIVAILTIYYGNITTALIGSLPRAKSASLDIFALKKEDSSDELTKQFTEEILPQLKNHFNENIDANPDIRLKDFKVVVELLNNNLFLRECK